MSGSMERRPDGTIVIPLVPADGSDEPREIEIKNVSMEALSETWALFAELDERVPDVPIMPAQPTAEQRAEFTRQARARSKVILGDLAYGKTLCEALKILTHGNESVTTRDLPSWASSIDTSRMLMRWLQLPLPGDESDDPMEDLPPALREILTTSLGDAPTASPG